MRLEIWEEPKPQEPVIKLRLVKHHDGIALCVADPVNPPDYTLVKIYDKGTIVRMTGLPKGMGFQLDPEGRIKLSE